MTDMERLALYGLIGGVIGYAFYYIVDAFMYWLKSRKDKCNG